MWGCWASTSRKSAANFPSYISSVEGPPPPGPPPPTGPNAGDGGGGGGLVGTVHSGLNDYTDSFRRCRRRKRRVPPRSLKTHHLGPPPLYTAPNFPETLGRSADAPWDPRTGPLGPGGTGKSLLACGACIQVRPFHLVGPIINPLFQDIVYLVDTQS